MKNNQLLASAFAVISLAAAANQTGRIDMELDRQWNLVESISGTQIPVISQHQPATIPGAAGNALRFDGYTTRVAAQVPEFAKAGTPSYTVSIWIAPHTYPMMSNDAPSQEKCLVAGTYDAAAKTGFGFYLGREGDTEFRFFSGGWPGSVAASRKLPLQEWTRLTAVVDGSEKKVRFYFNGDVLGETKCMNTNPLPAGKLKLGCDDTAGFQMGGFRLDSFNGLLDELEIFDSAIAPSSLPGTPDNEADMEVPAWVWDNEPLRPRFHAMPSSNWMNESHGLTYSNGRYHLFFQKNANGPYMSRLHWGHISSADLCTWKEEKIAIIPSDDYDIKGCWSGTIFTDDYLTEGKPRAYYTGVDYGKARIIEANPTDDALLNWQKKGIVVDGRPGGLSDDFRDCFVFRNGDDYYMIVGSSKDGKGVCTLHKYNKGNSTWSNDGKTFFQTDNASAGGTFWEMPSVTKFGDKWLFCVSPLGLANGVQAIYWVGTINADGTFSAITPLNQPGKVELAGTSRDGFGLLSPSIYQSGGRTLAMGIVPDKLPGGDNYMLGWAHNISLPREWSLDSNNQLVQKPAAELKAMRSQSDNYSKSNWTLNGSEVMGTVPGNRSEARVSFVKGNSKVGLKFFADGSKGCTVEYNPAGNIVTVDCTSLDRLNNDGWSFNGIYTGTLPSAIRDGEEVTLHAFADGSILDIFVNDKWAFSVRIFPTSEAAHQSALEIYSNGNAEIKSAQAWALDANSSGVGEIADFGQKSELKITKTAGGVLVAGVEAGTLVSVFNAAGQLTGSAVAGGNSVMVPIEGSGIMMVAAPGYGAAKIML